MGRIVIRVVRVIQYTYPDIATMERDMHGWTNSVRGQWKKGMTMQSTHFIPEHVDDAKPPTTCVTDPQATATGEVPS